MQLIKTSSDYAVEIETSDMLALLDYEHAFTGRAPDGEKLFEKLPKIDGVDSVDYDGHFGAAIYFAIATESDTPETHEAIKALIESHLAIARENAKAG